ncbi:hypothetical protein Chls_021 [Chlamydia suis]|uniref:Uncharacterized protein n=1 Tax=Chlamydia suis TaxID=83559 RepID=A0ABX6IPW6_9CHLA|nr:hypothetical protein Chls_021 [Chlamydia suis]
MIKEKKSLLFLDVFPVSLFQWPCNPDFFCLALTLYQILFL